VSIETAFLEQSRICATLGSPFMSRLMRMIGQNCAHHEACLRLFADWEKDAGITSGVLPLHLGAALHALVQAWDRATSERPLGYMSMEISDDLEGAKLTLQLWPGGQVHDVGCADFHGRWVSWVHPT
jgi:hypothetical protein